MKLKLSFGIFAVLAILIVATAIFFDAGHATTGAAVIGNVLLANPVLLPGRSGITIAHLDPETGRINVNAMRPYIDKKGMARIIANVNGQLGSIVTNAPALLRIDEWKDIDRTVIEASTQRLIGIGDLMAAGLTYNLGSIGVTMSLYEKAGDMTQADVSMNGTREGEKDKPVFDQGSVPVPIIHKDWFLNIRPLEASRRFGGGLDVTGAAIAGRVVAEKSEEILFNGAPSINVGGATIPGYTTHPNRNTVDMNVSWSSATPVQFLADVQAMLASARADGFYGPFNLYIPGSVEGRLDDDYVNGAGVTNRTLRQRILDLQGIAAIKVADKLAPDNVILVQMTRDVVDLAIAQDVTTLQWPVMGGMEFQYKTMAVWVPRIKAEFSNKSGVVHLFPIG